MGCVAAPVHRGRPGVARVPLQAEVRAPVEAAAVGEADLQRPEVELRDLRWIDHLEHRLRGHERHAGGEPAPPQVGRRGAVRRRGMATGPIPSPEGAHAYRREIVPETRTVVVRDPLDLGRAVGRVMRRTADGWWRATWTPDGAATLHVRERTGRVEA